MDNKISISHLTQKDIEALTQLVIDYKEENGKEIGNKEKQIINNQLTELIATYCAITLIAKKDEKIIGYLCAHIINFPMIIGMECYISDLLITKEFRGYGIGHLLLSNIEKEAKAIGCSRIMLNNPKDYESYNRNFYTKEGFEERINFANFVKPIENK